MKNKYVNLEKEFIKTIAQLSEVSGWSIQQAEAVLELMTKASEQKAEAVAERHRYVQKRAKVLATRHLLQNYRLLRASIERGLEHTSWLLEDTEIARLFEHEAGPVTQKAQSVAIQTAKNQVLWNELNTALDCFKNICENDPSPRVQREYRIIYERYISASTKSLETLLSMFHIEKSQYFRCVQEAVSTLSVILFGSDSTTDFCISELLEQMVPEDTSK